jgi:hypothetical protein
MPRPNAYLVDQQQKYQKPLALNATNYTSYFGPNEDEDDVVGFHAPPIMDIPRDTLYARLLHHPVPVFLCFTDRFGTRQTHQTITRQAFYDNHNVLYDLLNAFLQIDDHALYEMQGIRVTATYDEVDGPYQAYIAFNRHALPSGLLDAPRPVDLGLLLNRQMNIRDYIASELQPVLTDMLGFFTHTTDRIPARQWRIDITARDMQFPDLRQPQLLQ